MRTGACFCCGYRLLSLRFSGVVDNPPGEGVLVGAEVYPHLDDGEVELREALVIVL